MKKFLFMAVALLTFATAANAQKVNTSAELKKLEKADANLANPKKNTKAATWNAHGKAYADAYILPTKSLIREIPVATLQMTAGMPEDQFQVEFMGAPMIALHYEYVDVYVDQTYMIKGWNQLKSIKEGLAESAIESFKKAYELDPNLGSKINANASALANALAQQGEMLSFNGKTAEAAYCFELAYEAQAIAPESAADAANLYNAGMLYAMAGSTVTGEEAVALFKKCEVLLNKALANNYTDESGNIYYYLFHSYYAQKDIDRELYLGKAKEALLTGIKLFPKNNIILDGLMSFYTAEEGVGDPAELVSLVESSLKEDPTNYDLWFGRGRVFFALKNYDECVTSFKKCAELRPNEFEPQYYVGSFLIEKVNAEIEAINNDLNLSYEEKNAKISEINVTFADAIPWLERAHEFNPTDKATLDLLKQLCFRLRDMDGMMDKYNKYKALLDQIQ